MARLEVLAADAVADAGLRGMMQAAGGDEMFGVYGHRAALFKKFLDFYLPAKFEGLLPFALKELVRLRIAELNDCRR
jgi:hypothetical protein